MKNIMLSGRKAELNLYGGDYNMYEGYKKLNKDEYREFEAWIQNNNQELYENKIAYEVRWKEDEYYYVKLHDESIYTLNDILLDIHQGLV
jgi:hypothetical protein